MTMSARWLAVWLLAATAVRSAAAEPVSAGSAMEEEIVVTGTRIRRKDLTTPAPVTVVTRGEIEASGRVSIGEVLQTLPEQGNAFNAAVNNGGEGTTRVSLRSLGAQRTLVLVNGRRFVSGGLGADSAVDLNSIPSSVVERVEVLKDGASAMYGSDAIGGVVNIITRRKLDGTEVGGQVGTTTGGGGTTYDVSATTGVSSGRGGFLFGAEYYRQEPIWGGDRSWSSSPVAYDATGRNNAYGSGPGEYVLGNGTVPAGTFGIAPGSAGQPIDDPLGDARIAAYNNLVTAHPTAERFIRDPAASLGWRPFVPFALPPQGDAYNYWPQNFLVTPQTRVSLFATGERALGERARAYLEGSFVGRRSEQRLDPEPLVLGPGGAPVTVSKDSIYNPFGVDLTSVDRRLVELGHRTTKQGVDTFRIVGGVDGSLPETAGPLRSWLWDLSLNYGRSASTQAIGGSLRVPQLQAAVGPSYVDPVAGPRCGTPEAPIDGCVPLDLFGGPGSITPGMLAPLAFTGRTRGTNELLSVQANSSGGLFRLLADRPVSLAVGYEFRRVMGSFVPDPVSAAGESTGNQLASVGGAYGVHEGYAELSLPVVGRVPLAEILELTAAARVSAYSTFGAARTYDLGARWSPVRDVTLRGTWSTAFRAPAISELYAGQGDNFASVSDPCADAATAPPSCGAAAGNGDQRTQLRSKIGGNPELRPETAKAFTAGVALEPRWMRNLTITADYYRIAVDRAITGIGEATILASCYPADPSSAPRYCDLVRRDPAGQQIESITNLLQNAGGETVAGVDLAVRYVRSTRTAGKFGALAGATWLHYHDLTLPDGTVVRGRGNYDLSMQGLGGVQGVSPAWKVNAGVTWSLGGLGAGVSTRVVGSLKECGTSTGDFAGGGLCFIDATYQRRVDAWMSWDAFVAYTLSGQAGRTTIGLGVQNLFDADPPRIYNGFYAASDPTGYDYAGRFVYVRMRHAL